ncbi:MAG: hypothetical protein ACJATI_005593, partial [Halioglobus sp.]
CGASEKETPTVNKVSSTYRILPKWLPPLPMEYSLLNPSCA